MPRFESLSVLFGDEKSLKLHENLYYRILGGDLNDAIIFIDNYLKDHDLIELYDDVIIPMITEAEKDYLNESLIAEQKDWLFQTISDVINEMDTRSDDLTEKFGLVDNHCKIICLGARAERDDIASQILTQLLTKLNLAVTYVASKEIISNLAEILEKNSPNLICISVISPTSIIQAKYICHKLRKSDSSVKIIVGLWNYAILQPDEIQMLKTAGANEVISSMEQALHEVSKICATTNNPHAF